MAVIVAFVLDGAEAGAAETMQLQAHLAIIFVGADVNVRLFADADFVSDLGDGRPSGQRL